MINGIQNKITVDKRQPLVTRSLFFLITSLKQDFSYYLQFQYFAFQ